MPRVVVMLVLALLLAGAPRPAPAQTEAVPAQVDIVGFATEYTATVMIGVAIGGLVLHEVIGGPTATLAGALIGSMAASWLFIDQQARHYIIRRAGTSSGH